MTDTLNDIDTPSDAELISRVRGGDVAAYGDLFTRHVAAANRLARQLVRGPDADDLVSEAFAKVLVVLQRGGGPDIAFRAYLLTAVRRLHVDRVRASAKLQTSDDMEAFDPGVPFQDTAVAAFESGAAAQAFASLPERWQMVLWHLEVEGQKPAEVALLLGMSANSVSALAYRAREGLRQAFLTKHLNDIAEADCRWTNEHLGAFIRKGLAKRDSAKVQNHLDECRRCTAMYLELTEVNSNLAGIIAPLLLGAAATGYLATTSGAVGSVGVLALVGRARDAVMANTGVAAAGAVAAGVVAAVAAGAVLLPSGSPETVTGADSPIGTTSLGPDGTDADPDRPTRLPADPRATKGAGPTTSPAATPAVLEAPTLSALASPVTSPVAEPSALPTDPATEPTTDPTTEGPGPTDQPSPTDPTDGPTDNPGPTDPVETDLTTSGFELVGGNLRFSIAGTPELPPTVVVSLNSDPAGIVFGDSSSCRPAVGDPTRVRCETRNPLVAAPFRQARLAADGAVFDVDVPLVVPEDQPSSKLSVTVSIPGDSGYVDTDGSNDTSLPLSFLVTRDVVLASLVETGHDVDATGTDTYALRAAVQGWPSRGGDTVFTLEGGGAFGPVGTPGCETRTGTTVLCTGLSKDAVVDLRVVSDVDSTQKVTVTVSSPRGYEDPPGNNSAAVALTPVPEIDLALSGPTGTVQPDADDVHRLSTTVTGTTGLDQVTLRVVGATFASGGTEQSFRATGGTTELLLALQSPDVTTDQVVSLEVLTPAGYLELGPGPNARTFTLAKVVVPDTDFGFSFRPVGTRLSANRYQVSAGVDGIPTDATTVTFVLPDRSDDFLTPSAGCSLTENDTMVCKVAPGTGALSVTFTAKIPAGLGFLVARSGNQQAIALIDTWD